MIAQIPHNCHKTHESLKTHAFFRALSLSIFLFLSFFNFSVSLFAQEVTVTITPTQPILPPQVMLYITEPANYFNISLTNTGKDDANVYLVMQVEQVTPSSGLSLSTPARRQPKLPIVVPAGSTHILSPAEIRGLFNHIPLNEIQAPQDLFDNYANGSFGLLPEGQYEIHMTAYRWNLALAEPVVASSPSGGSAVFSVCYNAQAPEFLTPMSATPGLLGVADMNPMAPQFTWTAPVVACNPSALQYTYSLRIVELLPGQAPDNSMDSNPVVYQATNLSTPMCMIPQTVVKMMTEGKTYAAQITATSANVNRAMFNYVSIANNGKSTYKLFRLQSSAPIPTPGGSGGSAIDDTDEDVDDSDDDEGDLSDGFEIRMGHSSGVGSVNKDSLYTYRNPVIQKPSFIEGGTRQIFTHEPISVEWDPAWHIGGDGPHPDDNQFEYEVRIYNGGQEADREEAMKTEPIWKLRTNERSTTVKWEDLEKNAAVGDYLVLEVKPIVVKGESIAFTEDGNIKDFGINERLSKKYFQCEARVNINNTTPTSMSAQDLKGKEIWVGEYKLTIDDIKGSGSMGFSGTGRVEWKPFGFSLMVCVTFDKLMINDDYIVYDGVCVSAKAPEMMSSMEVVDKLFSDWGIDNLIGSTGLPYANKLQDEAKGKIKSLAEKANIGSYYKKLQDGKEIGKLLTTGKMDKVYMPVRFPESIMPANFDAVDLQIAEMKFAATYATMNIVGEATLPECDILKSKVLLFGAPRICISPNQFLPEDGHIALLGDFTLTPSADIEMTFKAPKDLLEPKDGCYISWTSYEEGTKLELLGIDADLKIADLVKDVNGTPTEEVPIMNLKASVGSWNDFLVDRVTIEDFQVKDLPGWTFKASDIVYDHSTARNSDHMGAFPKGYDKDKAGMKIDGVLNDLNWQGLHIGKIGVGFPKSLQVGVGDDKGDKRLWVEAKEMYWDQSGVTVTVGAENLFEGKEGTLGGWGISLDEAHVQIIQSNFDNAGFSGQINIPIFKTASGDRASKKDGEGDKGKAKEKERFGNVDYTCQIRNLTDPDKREKGERSRYSYVFLAENVGELDFSFFVAQAELDPVHTYFVVEAYDDEKDVSKVNTQVELCMGGEIGIGLVDDANAWLEEKTKNLPLELKIPDIHFTKMRLSNVRRGEWKSESKLIADKRKAREEKEQEIHDAALKIFMESNEINIGTTQEPFYFDLGEWSLASAEKHLGPFSFGLTKFSPGYNSGKVTLEIGGKVKLFEDKIDVDAAVLISAKLHTDGNLKDWYIDDGDVEFRELNLDLDFTAIHLKGTLKATDAPNKGYKGTLNVGIIGFFNLDCEGGYFEHKKDEKNDEDSNYTWGYFKATLESAALRFDPVVIDRISGGFFFNCRPTQGQGEHGKFTGDPTPQEGCVGIAFGLGLSSSAGKETLSADLDMLVVYDSENRCFSTFMLNGKVQAVAGLIKANCSLIYENEMVGGNSKNRYLCLNVTVEAGADTKELIAQVTKANAALESLQDKLNDFQSELDPKKIYQRVKNPTSGLNRLSGDYNKNKDGEAPDNDTPELSEEEKKNQEKKAGVTALKTKINLEFKITWAKDGQEYSTPKWHLYIGEPAKDKRCFFQFLKYDGVIVNVDIGADAYLCIGNELPDGGALPPIPTKITEFLSGHKADQADMGADLGKAERSRKAAAKKLLDPNSCNGGIMVGASAWGHIGIDLGLLYGSLDAIAGFDAALVNYGNNAFCVNSGSHMGYKGWYAMGQLYAYLAAQLGIHVHIGSFINEKVSIFDAGIGGVLEIGLPNPTWVEGSARIKISLLGGLCKINKKFEFSAGDHCVPFKGNALDGFEMFQGVSHGSDSIAQALIDPTFAISLNEAKSMTFTTQSSIGSHYRLVDPSWESELADKDEVKQEDLEKSYALNASRTYVFDINKDKNLNGMKMGVRLFDLGEGPTKWMEKFNDAGLLSGWTENDLKKLWNGEVVIVNHYGGGTHFVIDWTDIQKYNTGHETAFASNFLKKSRSATVNEASYIMQGKEITSGVTTDRKKRLTSHDSSDIQDFLNRNDISGEVNVSFREDKGSTFHLTNMDLKAGHSYMLILSADAYEIENGRRVWCSYYSEKDSKPYNIHWQQNKAWFFRIKGEEEEKIVTDSIRNLEPYVALAYPSTNGTRVVDNRGEGAVPSYFTDIMHPTIALNRDIRNNLPTEKMTWVLSAVIDGDTLRQESNAVYKVNGNCYNLEPEPAFREFNQYSSRRNANKQDYDFSTEQYHLQLLYTYFHKKKEKELVSKYNNKGEYVEKVYVDKLVDDKDSTFALVDLYLTPLPHHILEKKVDGKWYSSDNWLITTTSSQTEPVAYSKPFVGGCIDQAPTIEYEKDYYNSRGADLLTDEDLVFKNVKFQGIKNAQGSVTNKYDLPYRLIDPYLYFAYLGKWVFIGDREISNYGFDDVPVKFGSESLLFNYNGTTVNSEFLKDKTNKSLLQLRKQMYDVWNTWNYNDSILPKYPLPSVGGTIGGITAANQDGKASTVTPLNINYYTDYTYVFGDLVKDYIGAYNVAQQLCTKLKIYSNELAERFYYYGALYDDFNSDDFDNALNNYVKGWNGVHRGQYIEVSDRGYSVRVPFYQLPLIYGDCFGAGAQFGYSGLNRSDRTFSKSIGEGDMQSGDPETSNLKLRWPSAASNLLFFRLNDCGDQSRDAYGYNPLPFKYFDGDKYSLYNSSYTNSVSILHDQFDAHKALQAVTGFKARLYRVDCYDVNTGLYTVSPNQDCGGGPWVKTVNIGTGNSTAPNMDKMYEAVEAKDIYLYTHYDEEIPQVIWCPSTQSLIFHYNNRIVKAGDVYRANNKTYGRVNDIFIDEKAKGNNWRTSSIMEKCTNIVITAEFLESAKKDFRNLQRFFEDFKNVTSVSGLRYLVTDQTTDMSYMFAGCENLTSLDFSGCNTQNVTTMSHMFEGCQKLNSLDLSKFSTSKVKGMTSMFENCESLTSLDLSSFTGEALMSTSRMFAGCKKLTSIDISGIAGTDDDYYMCEHMFDGCTALRTLRMDALNPQPWGSYDEDMFKGVSSSLTCYYFTGLVTRVANQIPGRKVAQPDERAKVVYGRTDGGEDVLLFVYKPDNYKTGNTYTISASYLDFDGSMTGMNVIFADYKTTKLTVTVKGVWKGEDVTDTYSSPKWSTGASSVRTIYIDKDFAKAMPKSTAYWFKNFSQTTVIHGLPHLNTENVTNMREMFAGCSKLTKLHLGDFSFGSSTKRTKFKVTNVTDMTGMFSGCSKLETVDLGGGPEVTTTYRMFENCSSLKTMNFAGGSNVTDMERMFYGCSSLENIKSSITSDKVTDMTSMFSGCSSLTSVPEFSSTANVTKMSYMFNGCSRLKNADMSKNNTAKVTTMERMFYGCSGLEELYLGANDFSKLTNASNMFYNVNRPCYIYIPSDATRVVNVCSASSFPNRVLVVPSCAFLLRSGTGYEMMLYGGRSTLKEGDKCNISPYSGYTIEKVFSGVTMQNSSKEPPWYAKVYAYDKAYIMLSKVTKVYIHSSFSGVKIMNARNYFSNMASLTEIKGLNYMDVSAAKDLSYMFMGCSNLATTDGYLRPNNATDASHMFDGCSSMVNMPAVFGSSSTLTNTSYMFNKCTKLASISSANYPRTANVTDMSYMFYGCSNLVSAPLSRINTSSATNMQSMFYGCSKLGDTSLKGIKDFDTKNVTNMSYMLNGTQMSELDLSSWNVAKVTNMYAMFKGCTELRKLTLGTNFDVSGVTSNTTTFADVHDMAVLVPSAKLSTIKSNFTGKLGFRVGTTGNFYDENAAQTAQIIWTKGNKTLTFYYGMPVGTTFNGQTVTQKWSGDAVLKNTLEWTPWTKAVKADVTNIVIDKTFANARPTSTKGWFRGCEKVKSITGLENLCTVYSVTDMSYMFSGCKGLTELVFDNSLPLWGTNQVTTFSNMFGECTNLKKLVLTRFSSTSKVTSMYSMFYKCSSLEKLDVSMMTTEAVTNANYLFYDMGKLRQLTVGSGFIFPKLSTKASYAFSYVSKCEITAKETVLNSVKNPIINKLGFIEKSGGTNGEFVASDKKSVQAIWTSSNKTLTFYYGKQYKAGGKWNGTTITNVWKLSSGSTPWLDTVKGTMTTAVIDKSMGDYAVTSCANWFKECAKLTAVNGLPNLKTSSCQSYYNMFRSCKLLKSVDVSKLLTEWSYLTSSVTINLGCMFYECESLATIDVSGWTETARVSNMAHMFWHCKSVTKLDLSKWKADNCTAMNSMFSGCEKLATLYFNSEFNFNTSKVTNMSYMFYNCKSLTSIPVTSLNTQSVKDMSHMFEGCESWAASFGEYNPWNWETGNVTTMEKMFYNCKKISSLNLSKWNTANVTTMYRMFYGCEGIKETSSNDRYALLNVENFNVSKVKNMSSMFAYCKGIKWLKLSKWKTSALTDMNSMFYECNKLKEINISNFTLSASTDVGYAFYNCSELIDIDMRMKSQWSPQASKAKYMFSGCNKATIQMNNNVRVTTNNKNSSIGNKYVVITDCNSGTPKTNMVTTLKNLGRSGSKMSWFKEYVGYGTSMTMEKRAQITVTEN